MRLIISMTAFAFALAGAAQAGDSVAGWSATCGAPGGGGVFQACGATRDSAVNRCALLGQGGNVALIEAKPSAQCAAHPMSLRTGPTDYRKPPYASLPAPIEPSGR